MIVSITPPASEPITVAEVMAHCRLDAANLETGYADAIGVLISAARSQAEQELRRYLITQTLEYRADRFPWLSVHRIGQYCSDRYSDAITLPPAQSVTSIIYVDANGATQTLDAGQYIVDADAQPARIAPVAQWPTASRQMNAVKVRFVAGYGEATAVPACIKAWLLLKVAEMHPSVKQPMPEYADGLLDPERIAGRIV